MASADDRPQIAAALRMARSTIGAILRRLGLGKPKAHGTWPRLSLPCSSASASRGPRPECQSAAPRTKSLTVPDPFVAPRTHRGACALRGHQSLWNGPPLTAGVMMTSDLKERTDDQDPSRRGGPDDVQPVAVHHLRPAKRQTARQRDRVFSVSTISAVHRIDDRQGKVGETLDHMRLVVGAGKFFARGDVAEIAARREAPPGAASRSATWAPSALKRSTFSALSLSGGSASGGRRRPGQRGARDHPLNFTRCRFRGCRTRLTSGCCPSIAAALNRNPAPSRNKYPAVGAA